jgi:hypothetical protein
MTLEPISMTPWSSFIDDMADLNEQDATSQYSSFYPIFLSCVALYFAWQFLLRTGALWNSKSEPPVLPYLVPGTVVLRETSPYSLTDLTKSLATVYHF